MMWMDFDRERTVFTQSDTFVSRQFSVSDTAKDRLNIKHAELLMNV